eukprot:IDg22698t1
MMEFLRQERLLEYNPEDSNSMAAALRATQRFLLRNGYHQGRKKGAQHYRFKEDIQAKLDEYVATMMAVNEAKQHRVVYTDESYIHKNYARHEDSLYNPNNEQDLTTIASHKGQHYCFIAAILDADHSVPEEERT